MRAPRGMACAGELTVLRSKYSACHQGILDTLYIRLRAAPLVVMIIIRIEGTYNKRLVQLPVHSEAEQKLKHIIKGTECLRH